MIRSLPPKPRIVGRDTLRLPKSLAKQFPLIDRESAAQNLLIVFPGIAVIYRLLPVALAFIGSIKRRGHLLMPLRQRPIDHNSLILDRRREQIPEPERDRAMPKFHARDSTTAGIELS